jgi:hypothetical protein
MTEDHEVAGSIPARGTNPLLSFRYNHTDGTMDEFLMDVSDPDLTLSQIMHIMERYREENPGMEIYIDGDARAIMARPSVDIQEV